MPPDKLKHLEFIQSNIARMNTNSFQIKTFTITIVSALLAIFASTKDVLFILIGTSPTLLFWFLDTYYLQQERKFRGIYNHISGLEKIDEVIIKNFEMPLDKIKGKKYSYFDILTSKTIFPFYGFILILLVMLFIWLLKCNIN